MPNNNKKKARPKKKTSPTPLAKLDEVLTKAQQYYIRGNMEGLRSERIAEDLSLDVEIVREFIRSVRHDDRVARANRLMQRPAKGVVAMTEAASMASDDIRSRSLITQAEINRAAAVGNHELAAELVRKREEQQVDVATIQEARYGHCWHFIRKPGTEPPIDGRR